MTSPRSGTRRELNKRATKQAIVGAVADGLRNGAGTALTATQIAEAAGVSRRTLFNYFPSVDAVFSGIPCTRSWETWSIPSAT